MSNLTPKIDQTPAVLAFNYETFKADLERELEQYRTVVTADTVKEAKETATKLNKLKTQLDSERKTAIQYVSAPIKAADEQMKECVKLVADGRQEILDQVKVFEDETRAQVSDLLWDARETLFQEYKVADDFRSAEFNDLIKLTAITAKGKLTAAASRTLKERVQADRLLQDAVDRRILELENASYRAGLAAPLTRAHVEHFIRADEAVYAAKLDELMTAEIERDRQSREAIQRQADREAQAKTAPDPEPAPQREPEPANDSLGLGSELGHGGYMPQPEPEPEPRPAGKSAHYFMTVTLTATLPAGLTDTEVEQQFRTFIEGPGNTKVDFMTVMCDSDDEEPLKAAVGG